MKSTKLKMLLTATGFFALSATFAQDTTTAPKIDTSKMPNMDTTKMPNTDTTKMPQQDSTSMSSATISGSLVAISATGASSTATLVASVSEERAAKKMQKANPAKLPEDNQ